MLRRIVLQRFANMVGDFLWPLDLQRMVVDHADRDLLIGDALADRLKVDMARAARLECNDVGVDLIEKFERGRVALHLLKYALLGRVAPACVAPDFSLVPEALYGVVEYVDELFHAEFAKRWDLERASYGLAALPVAQLDTQRPQVH